MNCILCLITNEVMNFFSMRSHVPFEQFHRQFGELERRVLSWSNVGELKIKVSMVAVQGFLGAHEYGIRPRMYLIFIA
jgi:hypothetical protein